MKWFMQNKRKIVPVIIALGMILAGTTGVTIALLNQKTQAVANDFQGAAVNIAVYENGVLYEEQKTFNDSYERMETNVPVTKQVAVKNLYQSDYPTTDAYVRVRFVPAFVYDEGTEYAGQTVAVDMRQVEYIYGENDCWRVESGEDGENYYYYVEVLSPDTSTEPLITAVKYSGDIPENAHFELKVLAEAVAAKQKDCLSVWNLKDFNELQYLPKNQ